MPGDLAAARRAIRELVMPGQRRVHMKKESHARRQMIIDAITSTGATATIYNAGRPGRRELDAREGCLRALIVDITAAGHDMLVLEQDDSLLWWDQQRLIEITRDTGCRDNAVRAPARSTRTASGRPYLTQSPGAGPKADTGATARGPLVSEVRAI